ncbi:hypothetical protein Vretimale_17440 [Volvox reticuliferus]|uniref:Uncharacterized protein n=1 Tax=Volvox reticuliferus TaxID=1737510 RepID=A0A8J4CEJ9_9CHLO|nr:hypothetical protein Vretifemale_9419 [Volvox reticuliferus]GIM14504.1 hypothetical protein Vretimale_17440 [Volvox reticuliferus]
MFAHGGIDLDPCSSPEANTRVGTWSFNDKATDGLSEAVAWSGNVYINPPFDVRWGSSLQGLFFQWCVREYRAARVPQAALLLKPGVGSTWFRDVLQRPVSFVLERLSFIRQATAKLRWGAGVQNTHGSYHVHGPGRWQICTAFLGRRKHP